MNTTTKKNPYGVEPTSAEAKQVQFSPPKNNTLAIASLILGILSIFLSIITAIPGVVTGHMALSRIKRLPADYEGKGMAITGLVFSYFFLILTVVFIAAMVYLMYTVPGFKESLIEGFNEGLQEGSQRNLY